MRGLCEKSAAASFSDHHLYVGTGARVGSGSQMGSQLRTFFPCHKKGNTKTSVRPWISYFVTGVARPWTDFLTVLVGQPFGLRIRSWGVPDTPDSAHMVPGPGPGPGSQFLKPLGWITVHGGIFHYVSKEMFMTKELKIRRGEHQFQCSWPII